MIFGAIKLAGKVSTALWVVKTAHKAYKGYKKTEPAIKATGKVLKVVKGVKDPCEEMIFYLLLDAIGGVIAAFSVLLFLRVLKSRKFKYKFRGVISSSQILNGQMNYTVNFTVNGKEQSHAYSIRMPESANKQLAHAEHFSRGFKKGNKFVVMSKTADASTEVIPNDNPMKSLIVFLFLLIAFHVSAFLSVGSLFFSLGS